MAATPNVGKTHISHCRLIVDTADLSGVSRQVGSLGNEHNTTDVTGYSNAVHYVTIGQGNHLLTGYQAVFSNLAAVGSHLHRPFNVGLPDQGPRVLPAKPRGNGRRRGRAVARGRGSLRADVHEGPERPHCF